MNNSEETTLRFFTSPHLEPDPHRFCLITEITNLGDKERRFVDHRCDSCWAKATGSIDPGTREYEAQWVSNQSDYGRRATMNWDQQLQQGISPQGLLNLPQGGPIFLQLDEHIVEYIATHELEDLDHSIATKILHDACQTALGISNE